MNPSEWSPLTAQQRDIWVAHSLWPTLPQFNVLLSRRFEGAVDVKALTAALADAASRCDVFRLRFREYEGVPQQRVCADEPRVEFLDFSVDADPRARCKEWLATTFDRPMTLGDQPAYELAVLKESDTAAHTVVKTHHILADAWALNLFFAQVSTAYAQATGADPQQAGTTADAPPSYLDCLADEAKYRDSPQYAKDTAYFDTVLDGVQPALFTRKAPSGARSSARHAFRLPQSALERIRERGESPFAFVATAFAVYLSRVHLADDVVLGVPLLNRRGRAQRSTVGHFANTLPLRVDTGSGQTFTELVSAVQAASRELQRHERLPLGEVLRAAPADGPRALFDVTLSYVQWPAAQELPGLRQEITGGTRTHDGDALAVVVNETGDGEDVLVELDYARDVFDEDFPVEALARHLRNLVLGALEAPDVPVGELVMLDAAERQELTLGHNRTAVRFPEEATLHGLFAEQAARTPDRTAVVGGPDGDRLTYAELNARADRLAHALRADGVESGDRVAVVMERGITLMTAVLGTLKAGAAYVPVDPGYPAARIRLLLADSGAKVTLTGPGTPQLPDGLDTLVRPVDALLAGTQPAPKGPPDTATGPRNLAYVVYTSGSTGRPKGVMVEHRSVVNRLAWMQRRYPLGAGDVLLQKTPVSFDVSVWELFWWTFAGAGLALPAPGAEKDPRALLAAVEEHRVSVVHFVPSMFGPFLDLLEAEPAAAARAASLRRVFCSGEALPAEQVNRFNRLFAAARPDGPAPALVNLYGPTEATVDVSFHDCPGDAAAEVSRVPIGLPIDNTALYVLDPHDQPQPVGVPGELCIGGVGVARGYLGRPDLTAEKFTDDPFIPGGRIYRTGDLARRLANGELEYLGRMDGQVKLRGNRVELGEVEHQLSLLPGVRGAVALVREHGGKQLVGCYVADTELAPIETRTHLGTVLPEFMVPAWFVRLDRIPLTPNGKADRKALLRQLPQQSATPEAEHVAPRTATETTLAEIWSEVLGVERVGVHDDYYALGGDSILMLRVRAGAERRGLRLALTDIARHPTVADLAEHATQFSADEAESAPADEPFALITGMDKARLLGRGAVDAYPATRLHLGMLYHSSEDPASTVYRDVFRYQLTVDWDESAFRTTFARLVERHPTLRSSFALGGYTEPLQIVHATADGALHVHDLRGHTAQDAEAAVLTHIEERRHHAYDFEQPPLYHVRAHVRDSGLLDLVLSFHHAILDGWSVANLMSELLRDYAHALGADLAPVPEQALPSQAAYVREERRILDSAEAGEFWRDRLDGAELVQLDPFVPYEPPRAADADAGLVHHVELDGELDALLQEFVRTQAVPLRLVLFTAHCLTLRLLAATEDVTTGLVTHGRPETEGADLLAGLFLNTMPFRLRPGQQTLRDVVEEVVREERAAHPYRAYPLSAVQDDRGGAPLLDSAFTFVRLHNLEPLFQAGGIELRDLTTYEETNFALLVNAIVDPRDRRTRLRLNCSARAFTETQMRLFATAYTAILRRIVEQPDAAAHFGFLTGSGELPANPAPQPADVMSRFTAKAAEQPDAEAVVFGEVRWSYRDLDRAARQVTRRLRELGVPEGAGVGIALDRSPEMIATVIGVLRARAACVPLDVSYPPERIARMIERAEPFRVIAHKAHAGLVPDPALLLPVESIPMPAGAGGWPGGADGGPGDGADLDRSADLDAIAEAPGPLPLDSLALILFTSGSSGEPKGVELPHRLWANYTQWQLRAETAAPGARTLQFAPLSFDVSFQEIFSTFAAGGTLHLISEADRRDPATLLRHLDEQEIERWFMPFVALQQMAEAADLLGIRPRALRVLISSGEQLRVTEEVRRLCAGRPTLLENQYGPTETNIASAYLLSGDPAAWPALPPIGTAIDGAEIHVLDEQLRPVPTGAQGEIYLGGACLALGYRGREDLTRERFVPHPSGRPGVRLYRTGDVGRVLPSGDTVWLGRADNQVKVRGFRVEPAEVEVAITSLADEFPGIGSAAVVARKRGDGVDSFLVAYLLGDEAARERVDLDHLRARLRTVLPEYMVPAHLGWLDRLPMTPSGKRNDAALRALPLETGPAVAPTPPRDTHERALADIFGELLGRPQLGVHDDFFEAGGTSLTAMRLIVTIEKRFGIRIPLTAFVAAPTVAMLAERLRDGDAAPVFDPVVPVKHGGDRTPLFLVHPLGGNVLCYVRLARHLSDDQPLYALQAAGAEPGTEPVQTMTGLAQSYLEAIRRVQPEGPYRLGGWSFGGFVAFEMARQLRQSGAAEVSQLILLDSIAPDPGERPDVAEQAMMEWFFWELIWVDRGGSAPVERIPDDLRTDDERLAFIAERAARAGIVPEQTARTTVRRLFDVYKANWASLRDYMPEPEPVDLTLVKATAPLPDVLRPMHGAARTLHEAPANGWATLTSGRIDVVEVSGDHLLLLDEPHVQAVGRAIDAYAAPDDRDGAESTGSGQNAQNAQNAQKNVTSEEGTAL
ncbi:amino acid adenylation domain-containing protein [Streptomyces luteolus]|uniref:Amino acid adenylation domain-containing protein n=1 Tax=Streptomyces luteolus TaxID=3043615 RepID=A0ABT6T4S5_9ACTN|nr:non-ribosomal peptide synthetase [Streptomyces sp. B-S-A12]MDI3422645.1 amino acid adenylation domain-containing protein [Streptomyces sp. B-S-A12]